MRSAAPQACKQLGSYWPCHCSTRTPLQMPCNRVLLVVPMQVHTHLGSHHHKHLQAGVCATPTTGRPHRVGRASHRNQQQHRPKPGSFSSGLQGALDGQAETAAGRHAPVSHGGRQVAPPALSVLLTSWLQTRNGTTDSMLSNAPSLRQRGASAAFARQATQSFESGADSKQVLQVGSWLLRSHSTAACTLYNVYASVGRCPAACTRCWPPAAAAACGAWHGVASSRQPVPSYCSRAQLTAAMGKKTCSHTNKQRHMKRTAYSDTYTAIRERHCGNKHRIAAGGGLRA